jgi:uncharacterized membrane protein
MDWLQVALRILHIGASILWVGGAAVFSLYIEPTINALGPDAEKLTTELIQRRRIPVYFLITSTIAVLGGLILYWRDSNGLQLDWITSPAGLAFTIGGLAAIAAFLGGGVFIRPAVARVAALGGEMKAAGGPPTPELLARMHQAQESLRRIGLIDLWLLGIAVIAMASARFLG